MYVLVRETKEIDGRIRRAFFEKVDWLFCSMVTDVRRAKKFRTKKEAVAEQRRLGKMKEYFIGKEEDYT